MHHIQKDLLDATEFYYHYHDYQKEMRALAEIMENYYNQALKICADSPAEAVMWGANFDATITYPAYLEKEILPWIRKASDTLAAKGKILICHCDGENLGLMDLLRDSGMHVAEALSVLGPYLASDKKEVGGKALIGTVRGDMHDIGKNLVVTMLRGEGFEVRDMGINVPTEEIVRQAQEHKPDILGLSALLTTTMPEMKKVIDALTAKGFRGSIKVMVGGAPVNDKFARDISADGYAPDAGEAVTLAKRLMGNK